MSSIHDGVQPSKKTEKAIRQARKINGDSPALKELIYMRKTIGDLLADDSAGPVIRNYCLLYTSPSPRD